MVNNIWMVKVVISVENNYHMVISFYFNEEEHKEVYIENFNLLDLVVINNL